MSIYTAVVTSTGRDGSAKSSDGLLDVKLALQKELGGDGAGTNPEQLFAAGYAACFLHSMRFVARKKKIDITGAEVTAEVGLDRKGEGLALSATLRVAFPGEVSPEARQEIVDGAHQVCPYSNATRGNIPVDIVIA